MGTVCTVTCLRYLPPPQHTHTQSTRPARFLRKDEGAEMNLRCKCNSPVWPQSSALSLAARVSQLLCVRAGQLFPECVNSEAGLLVNKESVR